MDFEGQDINHPPLFKGEIFEQWKLKTIVFLDYYNVDPSTFHRATQYPGVLVLHKIRNGHNQTLSSGFGEKAVPHCGNRLLH